MSLEDMLDAANGAELPEEMGGIQRMEVEGAEDVEDPLDLLDEQSKAVNEVLDVLNGTQPDQAGEMTAEEALELSKKANIPVPMISNQSMMKRLTVQQHAIINFHIQGMSQKDICAHLNVSARRVKNTLNSQLAKGVIASYTGDLYRSTEEIVDSLHEIGMLAPITLQDVMTSNVAKDSDRIAAARTTLEYTAHKKGQQVTHEHKIVTSDHLAEMRKRLKEHDKNLNEIEDAKFKILEDDKEN
jgi:DNA-binding CsgD family transcriptional regulator